MQRTGYAAAALKTAVFAAGLCVFGACSAARLDIIQVGPWEGAKSWKKVAVLPSRAAIPRTWTAIAIIHGQRTSANDTAGIERQKLKARKMAAAAGADGLIMAVGAAASGSPSGGYPGPEGYLRALA